MIWPDEDLTIEFPDAERQEIDFGWQPKRRLPVFLLLDVSASMDGAPIQAVIEGVKLLHTLLLDTPTAVETVWISIITFGTEAEQIIPLTPITSFELKENALEAGGATSLGEAFTLLEAALDNEVEAGTATEKADWRPLNFLITDGDPTDDWEPVIERLKARTGKKMGTVVALACGNDIHEENLKKITDHVIRMENVNGDLLRSFFKWVSKSVSGASTSADASGRASQTLPPLPEGFTNA